MQSYKTLNKQVFKSGVFSIVPIRFEDRIDIMNWRNEQIYHLRQKEILKREDQDLYFNNVIKKLFKDEKPDQILFSFLKDNICIGYGGLVHVNWNDKNAEISVVMKTELEEINFSEYWMKFLNLLEKVAFQEIKLHKIYVYSFNLRPNLYDVLKNIGYNEEARLKEHYYHNNKYIDVLINSKIIK